ncbi:hypothetical protein HFO55_25685 [Rhizobium leguminosarum]|uniref:hypothetical protein n=1 Tax=Rhizobium leguminosarum TaxID=384 RepID=UPI001C98DDD1|nr:hypothetical protein [Rhizobium leguminosarum]MBY5570600.1 hypothetical protein [Rhizobium leguminosarum]MBY5578030.1 hypothetical protein [Rhizobium leguminosarum]
METTRPNRRPSIGFLMGLAMLTVAFTSEVQACAICFSGLTVTPGQKLDAADQVVLAAPLPGGGQFRVVGVIKGGDAVGDVIAEPGLAVPLAKTVMSVDGLTAGDEIAATPAENPLLIVRDRVSEKWTAMGTMNADHAAWLRQLAQTRHGGSLRPRPTWPQMSLTASYLTEAEWRERIALVGSQLESADPLVAEIAYGELSRAPYATMRLIQSQIDARKVRAWLADPRLASRRSAYTLLLGITGGAGDALDLERQIDAAMKKRETTNLSAMLAADLELRGQSRVGWLETTFLTDRQRSLQEVQAALLALSVHGGAADTLPRIRIVEAYRAFITARPQMAGFVAMELADWEAWEATPDYVAIIRANAVKDPGERFAILSYLQRSPRTTAAAAVRTSATQQQ